MVKVLQNNRGTNSRCCALPFCHCEERCVLRSYVIRAKKDTPTRQSHQSTLPAVIRYKKGPGYTLGLFGSWDLIAMKKWQNAFAKNIRANPLMKILRGETHSGAVLSNDNKKSKKARMVNFPNTAMLLLHLLIFVCVSFFMVSIDALCIQSRAL
ncbi:hypothetical protein L6259_00655 [Candidatus Parcubacteria bacterium]|nr:hypothetical protein [Candidatus Parcubacteria bacterium]